MNASDLVPLREGLLALLYNRRAVTLELTQIARTARRETGLTDASDPDVKAELEGLLTQKGWVETVTSDLGGKIHYRLTADGITYVEANLL